MITPAMASSIQPMAHLSRSLSSDMAFLNPRLLGSWLPIRKPCGSGVLNIDGVKPQHGQGLLTLFIRPVTSLRDQPLHVVTCVDPLLMLVRPFPGVTLLVAQRNVGSISELLADKVNSSVDDRCHWFSISMRSMMSFRLISLV